MHELIMKTNDLMDIINTIDYVIGLDCLTIEQRNDLQITIEVIAQIKNNKNGIIIKNI
jgi:hypothetical protein